MANLGTGALIERLIPSTTGRDIQPGDIGRIDDFKGAFKYFPTQWQRTGLWSMMHPDDLNVRYLLVQLPTPVRRRPTKRTLPI